MYDLPVGCHPVLSSVHINKKLESLGLKMDTEKDAEMMLNWISSAKQVHHTPDSSRQTAGSRQELCHTSLP
jgi:hypothetical protein